MHSRRQIAKLGAIFAATAVTGLATSTKKARAEDSPEYCPPRCLLRGTRVLTDHGYVAIERIAPGDRLVTKWRGLQPVERIVATTHKRSVFGWKDGVKPVRIKAGAFGLNTPTFDVLVSPRHKIYANGALFEAKMLVNGSTIVADAAQDYDALQYFNLRTAAHDAMCVEGLEVETLMEAGVSPAPVPSYRYGGEREHLLSRLRSLVSSRWFDVRSPLDIARDEVESLLRV